jgi:hypothetical protein
MRHTTYQQIMPGVYQIIPCSCNECTNKQVQEQQFESFLERLNKQYEEFYGRTAPSYNEYQRTKSHREDRIVLLT